MTERLLNLLEPRGIGKPVEVAGWVAGSVVGALIAIVALLVLMGAHIGA
jgi:hypothetical protein